MAKIFYGMAGEGRGHAARVRSVVEALRDRHELHLFAPGDAHDMLAPLYAGTEVEVHPHPGLRFTYGKDERVAYLRTGRDSLRFLARLPRRVRELARRLERERVDLVITDFEPLLPRAARLAGLPFVSLDHQHFLCVNDLHELPLGARLWARSVAPIVAAFHRGAARTIVSSFYDLPLKRPFQGVHQVGVLLRPELERAEPRVGEHLLAYVRRSATPNVLEALAGCGREVRVYGLGARPSEAGLHFRQVSEVGFLEDLASCRAVVSTAGNQLVGEALSLHKPVLALPEPGNVEQRINGFYLQKSGAGRYAPMERLELQDLLDFLEGLEAHRDVARSRSWGGSREVVRLLESCLPGSPALPVLRPVAQPA